MVKVSSYNYRPANIAVRCTVVSSQFNENINHTNIFIAGLKIQVTGLSDKYLINFLALGANNARNTTATFFFREREEEGRERKSNTGWIWHSY